MMCWTNSVAMSGLHAKNVTSKPLGQLVFVGDYYASNPLPAGTRRDIAASFLLQNTTRDLLFSAGGTRSVAFLEMTEELRDTWEEVAGYFGYERKPTEHDTMIVGETLVQLPGLKLITNSASGFYILSNPKTGLDEYHSFFVAEQQRAEGLAPAVWMFNKLTGNGKREKGRFYPTPGRAMSVISVVESEDARLFYSMDVKLTVIVNFPAYLLRILPAPKVKIEEEVGKSIQNTIAKDVNRALEAVVEAFKMTQTKI